MLKKWSRRTVLMPPFLPLPCAADLYVPRFCAEGSDLDSLPSPPFRDRDQQYPYLSSSADGGNEEKNRRKSFVFVLLGR